MSEISPTQPPVPPRQGVVPIAIEDEMRKSYLDYAMSVIVSRALPDVRDGLKPVHRRILYAMYENGFDHTKPYRKSARVVGDVMGKYHPHGDSAIYEALVRMAQDFSMRLPLIDGQGNFGSMDGDKAAAMRYTECRLARSANALLDDLDKNTVDFVPNYDGSEREPAVVPARFPNLLVNGAGGIAVGMATNIPPHNLGEVIDACLALLDDPGLTAEDLLRYVPAPDFPTGGLILGVGGARLALTTGRGSVVMRGRTEIEDIRKDRTAIIISEVPYQVNKSTMIEKIAECVREKRIEGISELRDESDRDGVRVVIELKRDAVPDVVLNQLYRYTPLQTSFGVNSLALNGGRPEMMNLRDMIAAFVAFREEVITRRIKFELAKARDRAHILVGLVIAVLHIDEVVATIRNAASPADAREKLLAREWPSADIDPYLMLINDPRSLAVDGKYRLTDTQVKAILDLRLNRLTALGRDEIGDELKQLGKKIEDFLATLRSRDLLLAILRDELIDVKTQFATPRRTEIDFTGGLDIEDEDLIQREDMVVTVTHSGYIKRVPLNTYRAQRRGGKGRSAMTTNDEDFLSEVFVASTHTPVLFFTTIGRVYKLKVWRLPLATPQSKGKALINMLPFSQNEKVAAILSLPEDEAEWEKLDVMFATSSGNVRRNLLSDFANVMSNGKIAMRLDEGDAIVGVAVCTEDNDVLLASSGGKAMRFAVPEVRVFKSRDSDGVRGMKLAEGDQVISMSILSHSETGTDERAAYLKRAAALRRQGDDDIETGEDADVAMSDERFAEMLAAEQFVLSVTRNGYGKRTSAYEYRITGRGGQGIINIETSARNGNVVAAFPVEPTDQIMMVTDNGRIIRSPVNDIRIAGRNTQGVILFRVDDDEHIVSVARLADSGEDGDDIDSQNEENGDDQ